MAAYPHRAPAKLILQARVDTLDGGSLAVTQIFSCGKRQQAAASLLGLQFGLLLGAAMRMTVDDRHAPQRAQVQMNRLGVVGRIHQVIEIGHAAGGHLGQRNRRLAIMQRGRSQNATNRNLPVGRVDM